MAKALQQVEQAPLIGGLLTVLEGGYVSYIEGEWGYVEWTLDKAVHLAGALTCWKNWKGGDYGYVAIANPAGMCTLAAQSNKDQVVITLPDAAYGPAYDPDIVGKPVDVELWASRGASTGDLRERISVQHVDGANVHCARNLKYDQPIGTICIPLYGLYSPMEGDDGLGGGIYLLDSGIEMLGSMTRSQVTEAIPVGQCVCLRAYAEASKTGTREIAINFSAFIADES